MSLKDELARRAVKAGLRTSFKLPSRLPLPVGVLRKGMEMGAQLFRVREDVHCMPLVLGNVQAERLRPGRNSSLPQAWRWIAAFIKGCGITFRCSTASSRRLIWR